MTRCYRRVTQVLWRRTADRVMLLPVPEGELISLSGTGVVLWDLLAAPASEQDLASTLAQVFGEAPERVAADIRPVLDDLVERRLIETVEAP